MSGIVGILNLDGAPVDRMLLQQMTDAMAFRGPDAQQVWVSGHIGLGHALLHTTGESQIEQQPASLDNEVCGELWITADARVDAQDELIAKLLSAGCRVAAAASDAELILHAYFVWGEKCLEHLLGDFAFAIWDGKKQVLFCARDHFGVKPFFYSRVGNCLVFGNTLDVIRLSSGHFEQLE